MRSWSSSGVQNWNRVAARAPTSHPFGACLRCHSVRSGRGTDTVSGRPVPQRRDRPGPTRGGHRGLGRCGARDHRSHRRCLRLRPVPRGAVSPSRDQSLRRRRGDTRPAVRRDPRRIDRIQGLVDRRAQHRLHELAVLGSHAQLVVQGPVQPRSSRRPRRTWSTCCGCGAVDGSRGSDGIPRSRWVSRRCSTTVRSSVG